jgi:DNA polymerase/3'-5' exonuclease PolX
VSKAKRGKKPYEEAKLVAEKIFRLIAQNMGTSPSQDERCEDAEFLFNEHGKELRCIILNHYDPVVQVAGSLRRMASEVGDIDLVVRDDALACVRRSLNQLSDPAIFRKRDGEIIGGWIDGIKVEVVSTTKEGWGACLMYRTGSAQLNIIQRATAKAKGFLLNEKGLWDRDTGEYVCGEGERGVYEAVGIDWLEPVDRSVR